MKNGLFPLQVYLKCLNINIIKEYTCIHIWKVKDYNCIWWVPTYQTYWNTEKQQKAYWDIVDGILLLETLISVITQKNKIILCDYDLYLQMANETNKNSYISQYNITVILQILATQCIKVNVFYKLKQTNKQTQLCFDCSHVSTSPRCSSEFTKHCVTNHNQIMMSWESRMKKWNEFPCIALPHALTFIDEKKRF